MLNVVKMVALYYSSKIKTSVLEGILSENSFKSNIGSIRYFEDVLVAYVGASFDKKVIVLNDVNVSDRILLSLQNALSEPNKKCDVILFVPSENDILKYRSVGAPFKSVSNFKMKTSIEEKGADISQIDQQKNHNIIASFGAEALIKFVRRQTASTYSSALIEQFDKKFELNLDIVTYDDSGILEVFELKRKNVDGYLDQMNVGEYKLLRNIKRNGVKVRYFIDYKSTGYSEYSIDFEMDDRKIVEKEQARSTSFKGNKVQKTWKLLNVRKLF